MEYLQTARRLAAQGETLARGSAAEREALERFKALLGDFKGPGFKSRVREVYAEDVWFNDSLKTVRGVEELERYLGRSADALDSGTVEFLGLTAENGDYFVRWQMNLSFAKLDRGTVHRSVGMSHLRFDREGKVVLHQDFWDSTGGLFEHVPGLGWLLRQVKRGL